MMKNYDLYKTGLKEFESREEVNWSDLNEVCLIISTWRMNKDDDY